MNDIMAVDHGIVWVWKSSMHSAVNRTVAVACRPRFFGSLFEFNAEENGRATKGCLHVITHRHAHILRSRAVRREERLPFGSDQKSLQGGLITLSYTCQITYQRS